MATGLMWASPETTWAARPQRFAAAIARRIRTIFPRLGQVEIAEVWGGAIGQTVHGMPQIGQLRRGLWVASGFGRQGLNTSAMAGQLIARSILWGDERWRLFSPFELVWAGGPTGRVAGHVDRDVGAGQFRRRRRVGPLPGTGAGAGTHPRGAAGRGQSPGRNRGRRAAPPAAGPPASQRAPPPPAIRPARPNPAGERRGQFDADRISQESEKFRRRTV